MINTVCDWVCRHHFLALSISYIFVLILVIRRSRVRLLVPAPIKNQPSLLIGLIFYCMKAFMSNLKHRQSGGKPQAAEDSPAKWGSAVKLLSDLASDIVFTRFVITFAPISNQPRKQPRQQRERRHHQRGDQQMRQQRLPEKQRRHGFLLNAFLSGSKRTIF